MQQFAQRAGFIAGLHTSGKLNAEEAFAAISSLWWELAEAYCPLVRSQTIDS